MKIGIVTFWSSKDNYGQLLQLFALQTFLKELGHEPFLIRYAFWKDNSIPKLFKEYFLLPWRIPRAIKNKIAERKVHKSNIVHERKFVEFLSENILYTEQIYSTKELINNPPIADCYITGSDQVWGALTPNPVFFLQFGAKEIKRISFAASFGDGNDFFKDGYISKVTPYLNKFDMVTVREYKALDVCKKAGINGCILFPDPTLLIDMSNYNRLLFSNLSTDKYCLIYMLEGEEKTKMSMDDIVAFVKDMGAKMIYVASQGRFDKYAKQYPTIPQFLSYIKNADFVITNSFHGTVFSIMYHRRFVVIPKKNGNNTRIETLLSQYGLQQHIVEEPAMIKKAYNDVVDWTLVDNINEKKKKETVDLLQRVIGGK